MKSVRSILKSNPVIHALGKEFKSSVQRFGDTVKHGNLKRQRQGVIATYLAKHRERKLHIGCGPMILEGWINSDFVPRNREIIFLDITEKLPFPDASLDYIYSEHLIEHVSLSAGIGHFKDCLRVLKPGGVIRVATPDLQFLLDYFGGKPLTPVQQGFLAEMMQEFHPELARSPVMSASPAILLNEFVRDWGHMFIYDRDTLGEALHLAGFARVKSCEVKESDHAPLRGLEQHGTAISDAFNRLQTMVLEGTKGLSAL
jgi:predicted SAM-dependent methyltransferase